jgi:hypothetical protein
MCLLPPLPSFTQNVNWNKFSPKEIIRAEVDSHILCQKDESLSVNDALRFLLELVALFSLGLWGCVDFSLPWPGSLVAAASVAAAAVLWGTFRSPKAPVRLRVFGRAVVEIIVMGTAVFVWFAIGLPLVGSILGIIVIASGIYNLRKEVRAGRP